jgi:TDG/mug DNA glycosylase family protein
VSVLPDILAPNLRIVFCGTAVGQRSAQRGHYYAGPGNDFWRLLHDTGLTPRLLAPDDDVTLPTYGLGLTDLAQNVAQSHDRGPVYDAVAGREAAAAPTTVGGLH